MTRFFEFCKGIQRRRINYEKATLKQRMKKHIIKYVNKQLNPAAAYKEMDTMKLNSGYFLNNLLLNFMIIIKIIKFQLCFVLLFLQTVK